MVPMTEDRLPLAPPAGVDAPDRVAAIDRLHDLVRGGSVSLERFSAILGQVLAASDYADLEAAMSVLPPLVRITPASRRLAEPLVLRADGDLKLGAGWQLAADTTIHIAFGTAWLDLTAASWDANQINLRLETRAGAIEVIIPEGVATQMVGGSGRVQLLSLSAPVPAGPVLRVSTLGATGVIRIRHPKKRTAGRLTPWRRYSHGQVTLRKHHWLLNGRVDMNRIVDTTRSQTAA
jgi:hypothetical protein